MHLLYKTTIKIGILSFTDVFKLNYGPGGHDSVEIQYVEIVCCNFKHYLK